MERQSSHLNQFSWTSIHSKNNHTAEPMTFPDVMNALLKGHCTIKYKSLMTNGNEHVHKCILPANVKQQSVGDVVVVWLVDEERYEDINIQSIVELWSEC